MSDSPSLVEDIYVGLKNDLLTGSHLPGERIDITEILKRFRASKTPVLLALNRLVGEGIVETHPHDGYYIPRLTTDSLREIYECDIQILNLVLDGLIASDTVPNPMPLVSFTGSDDVIDTERLFLALSLLGGNREFGKIISGTNDRLRPLRRLKAHTSFNKPTELADFKDAWRSGNILRLKDLLGDYHKRRIDRLSEFIALAYTAPMNRPATSS